MTIGYGLLGVYRAVAVKVMSPRPAKAGIRSDASRVRGSRLIKIALTDYSRCHNRPMSQEMTTSQGGSIKVRADNSVYKGPLIGGAPLIVIGTLRIGFRVAAGRGTSVGAGWAGLVVSILAVVVPLVWFAGGLAMRRAKAGIVLDDGVLSVRDRWGRLVLQTLESDVTGLHKVRIPVDGNHKDRVVITSLEDTPLVLDPRLWEQESLQRLFDQLTAPPAQAPVRERGSLSWSAFRTLFPGAKVPWRQVHYGWFTSFVVILGIAYVSFFVNLSYFV
ncbi:hypothetical protein [Kitasatospora azatica]|uniref:hypothetical protein n=1 Tax=Kitasatospora azatica TaxID=58347 RepID=UPI000568EB27|nr:hypothetical protein [Kitasatospora azatica]